MQTAALFLALFGSATAFAPATLPSRGAALRLDAKSASMPFLEQPPKLDGSMAGDVGFDPLGLSNIDDVGIDLYWMREAELKHARLAMLATAGVFWVEIFGSFPGMPVTTGKSQTDAFWDVWAEKPNYICFALCVITVVEAVSGVAATQGRENGMRDPGDFMFNPNGFQVTEEMKMKEIANGRLAMWAAAGLIVQGMTTHVPAISGNFISGL